MVKVPFDISKVSVANAVAILVVVGYFGLLALGITVPTPIETALQLVLAYLFTSSSYNKGLEKGQEIINGLRQLEQP